MKSVIATLCVLGCILANAASDKVLNWPKLEGEMNSITQQEARTIVSLGVQDYFEGVACYVDQHFDYEASKMLRNIKGNPTFLVYSKAEVYGTYCDFPKYADCETAFVYKPEQKTWSHVVTECFPESIVMD